MAPVKLRIAILIPSLEKVASVAYPLSLADHFLKQGHHCDVFYFNAKSDRPLFPHKASRKLEFGGSFDWEDYDIVNSHGLIPDLFVFLKKPRACTAKAVSTLHAFFFEELRGRYNIALAWIVSFGWRKILARHQAYVCLTKNGYEHFRRLLTASKISYIHSGIEAFEPFDVSPEDTQLFADIKSRGMILVGTVSRLVAFKGIEQAVKVLTKNPRLHLVIVGDGPERVPLRALSEKLRVHNRVSFLGYRNEGRQFSKYFDAFLMTSYTEPFGLTLLEAAASQVPIVCSNIGTFKELFKDDEVSFFETGNIESLSQAISRAVGNQDQVQRALHAFENKYSAEKMTERYIHLFDRILWPSRSQKISEKPTLAVVVDEYPYPPFHGGSLANAERLDILAEEFNLHLFCLDKWNDQVVPVSHSLIQKNKFSNQIFFPYKKPWRLVIPLLDLTSLMRGSPYFSHGTRIVKEKCMRSYLDDNKIHKLLLLNSFILPLEYLKSLGLRTYFIDDNATYKISSYEGENPLLRIFFSWHNKIKGKYERRVINQSQKAACLTVRDEHDLRELGLNKKLQISALPIRPKLMSRNPQENRVLIAANMDYEPNRRSLAWFKDEVIPHLATEVRVHLCGKDTEDFGKNLFANIASVVYLGYLSREGLEKEYSEAKVVANPTIEGSGLQLKLMEALAYGLPVVSTTYSNPGLTGVPSSDNPELFAKLIMDELKNNQPSNPASSNYETQREIILNFIRD